MTVDYTPEFRPYRNAGKFRYWCQTTIPLVYDDSKSYLELLYSVISYLNSTIEDVAAMGENTDALLEAYNQLQAYVNRYFDSLDVQEEINQKLDDMAASGDLDNLLEPFVQTFVSDWLQEHLTPTSPPVDDTLTIEGAAADAKVTGDKLSAVDSQLIKIVETVQPLSEESNRMLSNVRNNVIFNATSGLWDDTPSGEGGTFLNIKYTTGYDQQLFIVNSSGDRYDRVVSRSGSIYRGWTAVITGAEKTQLTTDTIKYIAAVGSISTETEKKLANINSNVILNATSTYFDDTPTGAGGTFINIRYSTGYNQQFFIENSSGDKYDRVVSRTGQVYRTWTGSVSISRFNTVETDSIKYISAIAPISEQAGKLLSNVHDNVIFNGSPSYFDDTPTGKGGSFLNIRYTSGYDEQFFIESATGHFYERVVGRTGSVYRNWTLDSRSRFLNRRVYCAGDSIMWGRTSASGRASITIPQAIASRFPVEAVNAGVGGDTIASRQDGASVYDRITKVDLSGYDYVVINGGTNDYGYGVALGTIDSVNPDEFYGAYNAILSYIYNQKPSMRIMLITPTFRNYVARNGEWIYGNSFETAGTAGYTMKELTDAIKAIGKKYNVPVFDSSENSPVNLLNYQSTMELTDGSTDRFLHLNNNAYKEYGYSIASFFGTVF